MRKMMASIIACVAAVAGTGCAAAAADPDSMLVLRVIQPAGWTLPEHGKVLSTGIYRPTAFFPAGVTFVEYEVDPNRPIIVPRYHFHHGDLVLDAIQVRIVKLRRIDVGGRTVAYVAGVMGTHIGISGEVWWMDEGGTGVFTVFRFGILLPELAEWLQERAGTS